MLSIIIIFELLSVLFSLYIFLLSTQVQTERVNATIESQLKVGT